MQASGINRLAIFLPLLLCACASGGISQGQGPASRELAQTRLLQSAHAHGLSAFRQINDLTVSYTGEWRPLVASLQPVLIDPDFRQGSQETLLLRNKPLIAQRHQGPQGEKHVVRDRNTVRVAYNGQSNNDRDVLDAAALVADGYRMFLTGPFYFLDGNVSLETADDESVEGVLCSTLTVVRLPGNGFASEDRYQLFIDKRTHLLRRIRFTLEGLASTQGAIAEVDFLDYRTVAGVTWPTRFFERLRKPIPGLPVHAWQLTGMDINRGLTAADFDAMTFSDSAQRPPLPLSK